MARKKSKTEIINGHHANIHEHTDGSIKADVYFEYKDKVYRIDYIDGKPSFKGVEFDYKLLEKIDKLTDKINKIKKL